MGQAKECIHDTAEHNAKSGSNLAWDSGFGACGSACEGEVYEGHSCGAPAAADVGAYRTILV